jgi:ornithine cyclodeaminase
MELRLLTGDEVRQSLPMASAIEAMKIAYIQLSTGQADVPLRTRIDLPRVEGSALFMPAYLRETGQLAIKYVSVFPQNTKQELPTIHAMVLAIDDTTGRPLALMEGASLTAIRTGAASGAATDVLARQDAVRVAIFGSGVQARTQLEAVCSVRPIEHAFIYSLDTQSAQVLIRDMAGTGAIPAKLELAQDPHQAACEADIICTATTSLDPVLSYKDLQPGVHINAIGSFTPAMQEIDSETIRQALLVVDSREAVLAESGDLIIPMREGVITESSIHAELGEILAGKKPGRESATQITLFKSVGVAVQDAIAAHWALDGALQANFGTTVNL